MGRSGHTVRFLIGVHPCKIFLTKRKLTLLGRKRCPVDHFSAEPSLQNPFSLMNILFLFLQNVPSALA